MAAPLLPSFLTVTARRRKLEIAWIATILLSGSLGAWLGAGRQRKPFGPAVTMRANVDGSNCMCGYDGYCMCTPALAVDILVEVPAMDGLSAPSILLVRRADSGKYATIGGFVEVGESVEETVSREVKEETGLDLLPGSVRLFSLFSDPRRDHRRHTVSVVWIATVASLAGLKAGDDAKAVEVVEPSRLRSLDFAFDHALLVSDYLELKRKHQFPEDTIQPTFRRSSCPVA
jgi:8-oxo-dGTP diphosphatase